MDTLIFLYMVKGIKKKRLKNQKKQKEPTCIMQNFIHQKKKT